MMSQLDEVRRQGRPVSSASGVDRRINWAVLVVLLAMSCTLAWIYLWLWAAVRVLRAAFF